MEKKFKKYALKISLFIGKLAHIFLPNYIFLPCLTAIKKIPYGSKIVMCFDPNLIRKEYEFNLKPREYELRGKDWKLILKIRERFDFGNIDYEKFNKKDMKEILNLDLDKLDLINTNKI